MRTERDRLQALQSTLSIPLSRCLVQLEEVLFELPFIQRKSESLGGSVLFSALC